MPEPHCIVYHGHTAVSTGSDPAAALEEARRIDGFVWVAMSQPTQDDVQRLAHDFGLESFGVASALRSHQRSKLSRLGEHLFVVVQPATYDDGAETVECHEVDLFVGEHFVVALSPDGQVDLDRMRSLLDDHPQILDRGSLGILWAAFEYVTRGYRDVLDGIEHDIDEIEEELFTGTEDVSRRIFALQREVIDLSHATAPLEDMLVRMQRIAEQRSHRDDAPAFRDLTDRARYVDARVSSFRGTLDNALTIHSTIVDQRRNESMKEMTAQSIEQNDQVKKISSWAAIGFAPTLVAGIYGMNFRFMPELSWPFGYPFAIGLMVAVSAGLYAIFKRRDWL